MDMDEFCKQTENLIDYIIYYFGSVYRSISVATNVCPGYLKTLLPENPPTNAESLEKIMEDFEKYIMPGLTHFRHPGFHAYYPTISSYPSILGGMICEILGCRRFNYNVSSIMYELEAIVLDWYGKMIGLPSSFLRCPEGSKGGGLLLGTTSHSVLISMITARQKFLLEMSKERVSLSKPMAVASLVAYCSSESHAYIRKSVALTLVNLRILDTDEDLCLRGETLAKAVKEDKEIGMTPFFVSVNIGTKTGAIDPIEEIEPICKEYRIWLHVDASYAGNAMICPEYQHFLNKADYVSSITITPAKWLPVHLDCSVLFAKDVDLISQYQLTDGTMLAYGPTEEEWCYSGTRSSKVIKFYVMLCIYGVEGLQAHIRNHIQMAKLFEEYVRGDERFDVLTSDFGIVCFRLRGTDESNKRLLTAINRSGKLLLNSHRVRGKFALRFFVCAENADEGDMISAWTIIQELIDELPKMNYIEDEEISKEFEASYDYTFL